MIFERCYVRNVYSAHVCQRVRHAPEACLSSTYTQEGKGKRQGLKRPVRLQQLDLVIRGLGGCPQSAPKRKAEGARKPTKPCPESRVHTGVISQRKKARLGGRAACAAVDVRFHSGFRDGTHSHACANCWPVLLSTPTDLISSFHYFQATNPGSWRMLHRSTIPRRQGPDGSPATRWTLVHGNKLQRNLQ